MRDESGTGFTLEMSPGVATAGAGESQRVRTPALQHRRGAAASPSPGVLRPMF